jgi:hypothetical protein
MPNPIIMVNVTGVEFGTLGTVNIKGGSQGGDEIKFSIPVTSLQNLIPDLARSVTLAIGTQPAQQPNNGDPVPPEALITVTAGNAFPSGGDMRGLTLHTYAGLFQFDLPPSVAEEIRKGFAQRDPAGLGSDPVGTR